jgi:hypothetical protein
MAFHFGQKYYACVKFDEQTKQRAAAAFPSTDRGEERSPPPLVENIRASGAHEASDARPNFCRSRRRAHRD